MREADRSEWLDASRPQEPSRFRFAGCEIDVAKRSVERRGEPVEVEPRVFDVLVFLIEHRERVVSAEELLDALWGGAAVTPSSLSQAVYKARLAVGDDGERQCVIRTVHRRGFRFVAPVPSEIPEACETQADFVGRQLELQRLEAALRRVRHACGGLVTLVGEPGIGKTRLACEFSARVMASCAAGTHRIQCLEAFETAAYWPWCRLGRALASDRLRGVFERLARGKRAHLALVEPADAGATTGLPASGRPTESARLHLFESAVAALAGEAQRRPIVVVIDDLQWADLPSLAFLRFLAGCLPSLPILVVAAFREADLARDRERSRLLADAGRSAGAETLTLAALSRREIGRLAEARLGRPLMQETVAALQSLSSGNPRTLGELMAVVERPGGEALLPESPPLPRAPTGIGHNTKTHEIDEERIESLRILETE